MVRAELDHGGWSLEQGRMMQLLMICTKTAVV
jgi:hypothetical protein